MDEQRLKRLALDGIFWKMAHNNIGIYPRSITGGEGAYEERSERMEGWNDASSAHTDNYCSLERWHSSIQDEFRDLVTELLLEGKVELHVDNKECKLNVNCSDTFYWGCSDDEEISFTELGELKECCSLSHSGGDLWTARKRKMRAANGLLPTGLPKGRMAAVRCVWPRENGPRWMW